MEYVITFSNTNQAIKSEKCLLNASINAKVMPLPTQISAGCGICLRVSPEELSSSLEILSNNQIENLKIYMKENGQFIAI